MEALLYQVPLAAFPQPQLSSRQCHDLGARWGSLVSLLPRPLGWWLVCQPPVRTTMWGVVGAIGGDDGEGGSGEFVGAVTVAVRRACCG